MNSLRYVALFASLLLLYPVCALAKAKNEHSVDITNVVQLGNTQLKPGNYKVEWQEPGPVVNVKFVKDGEVVATAKGTLKTNDKDVIQDDVVVRQTHGNQVLTEIDFLHQKEALLFGHHRQGA
jgi:hypothetical protein